MRGTLLADKIAIVTGGSRGLGEGIVREFVDQGAKVAILDILADEGAALCSQLGANTLFRIMDVSSETAWSAAITAVEEIWGGVDILVNNAAILHFSTVRTTALSDYQRVIAVNQTGTFLGMRAVIDPMRRRGGGSIINLSSVDGMKGSNGLVAYAASKWAVRGMTKVAAQECGKYGIRVNSIHPGSVLSAMTPPPEENPVVAGIVRDLAIPRVGVPSDVGHVAVFLASELSSYVTGCEFPVDGGFINCRALPIGD